MALPLPRVIPDTEPGGGLVTAIGGMNSLAHNMLKRKYYEPDIKSQIANRNALTEGYKISNQYMPDKLRLANELAMLANQFYAPNIQSEINSRNAMTEGRRIENQYAPDKLRLANEQAELENKWYQPKTEADIKSKEALSNWRSMGGSRGGVDQQLLVGFGSQIAKDNPALTPEQVEEASNAYLEGYDSLLDGTKLPPLRGKARQLMDVMTKKGTTAQGLNQQRFAATTDAILEDGKNLIPIVSKYASLLGSAKGKIDSVKNSLGVNSPDYQDYVYFTRTFVPYAAGEMMRALGVNASDTQKEIYQQVINPISWDQNPAGAVKNYEKMVKLFKETVSKTVGKSTSEIRAGLRNKSSEEKADVAWNPETGNFEEVK